MEARRREGERAAAEAGGRRAGGGGAGGEPGPGPEPPGGYLSEEAGDHLLEGVLVHLVHLHGDPHPRAPAPATPPRAQGPPAPPGLQAATRGRPRGRGVFFLLFQTLKLYCPPGETDRRSGPRPLPPTSSVGPCTLPSHGLRIAVSRPRAARQASEPWTLGLVCASVSSLGLEPQLRTADGAPEKGINTVNSHPPGPRSCNLTLLVSAGRTGPRQLPPRLDFGSQV